MVELLGMEGLDEAEVVGDALELREKVRDLDAGLAALLEGELVVLGRAQEIGLLTDESELFPLKNSSGQSSPLRFWSSGLKSKRSRCDGAPTR